MKTLLLLSFIALSYASDIFSKEESASKELAGIKIAILVDKGFEQVELTEPKKALDQAGAQTFVISPQKGKVQAWKTTGWGSKFPVDVHLDKANPDDYTALLLPGGVMNPDSLRINPKAVAFVKSFVDNNKPIAAICHGPWTLINAGGVKGFTITSWPSLEADLTNAGAKWVNQQVVTDRKLVTSRKPEDIPAFNAAMIHLFKQPHNPTRSKIDKLIDKKSLSK